MHDRQEWEDLKTGDVLVRLGPFTKVYQVTAMDREVTISRGLVHVACVLKEVL